MNQAEAEHVVAQVQTFKDTAAIYWDLIQPVRIAGDNYDNLSWHEVAQLVMSDDPADHIRLIRWFKLSTPDSDMCYVDWREWFNKHLLNGVMDVVANQ